MRCCRPLRAGQPRWKTAAWKAWNVWSTPTCPGATWTLPKKGLEIGFFGFKQADSGGEPEKLRFENGRLADASVAGAVELDLDD